MSNKRDLLLRWCVGDSDTTSRSEMEDEKFIKFLQMTKLSIYSFQKFFDADFLVCYNGSNWKRFNQLWTEINPSLSKNVSFFNQRICTNPYSTFFPLKGVWWKWIPFRYDSSKTEISIDTDVICLSEPKSWKKWIDNDTSLLIPFEAIPQICEATCGDVWTHPSLEGKRALNCGIIGQKKDIDVSKQFFKLTELIDYGSYNGNFVTEQGLFNILYHSLVHEDISHYVLPYEQNMQAKHLLYYLSNGENVETVHFTARSKLMFYDLYDMFKQKIDEEIRDVDVLTSLTEWDMLTQSITSN